MAIQTQSRTNPLSILCQSRSTHLQSSANLLANWTNPFPIHQFNPLPIRANPVPIICQFRSIQCQSTTDPVPIWWPSGSSHCQSITNMPIHYQYANSLPIRQSITNPPIKCQSVVNLPIHHQSAKSLPIRQSNTNLWPICQSITNSPISDQSTNLRPIHLSYANA